MADGEQLTNQQIIEWAQAGDIKFSVLGAEEGSLENQLACEAGRRAVSSARMTVIQETVTRIVIERWTEAGSALAEAQQTFALADMLKKHLKPELVIDVTKPPIIMEGALPYTVQLEGMKGWPGRAGSPGHDKFVALRNRIEAVIPGHHRNFTGRLANCIIRGGIGPNKWFGGGSVVPFETETLQYVPAEKLVYKGGDLSASQLKGLRDKMGAKSADWLIVSLQQSALLEEASH
jgi:hypothetical protein